VITINTVRTVKYLDRFSARILKKKYYNVAFANLDYWNTDRLDIRTYEGDLNPNLYYYSPYIPLQITTLKPSKNS
jgi:hypothetical protein